MKKNKSNPMESIGRKIFLSLFFFFAIGVFGAIAQTNLTGTVTDDLDQPLPGVSVVVQGTTTGIVTDFDGKYSINVKPSDVLVFSYLGMKDYVITVGTRSKIDVVLQDDAKLLSEAVVIGYGSAKAKDLTSPITVLKADDISRQMTSSPMGGLQGKIAGVQIVGSGKPGGTPNVRIRGAGSFNIDKQTPLYVVDGMFFDNIDFLNNDDIESMSVLKDASSSAIYGVRAANGVVIITTKKGIPNRKPQVTYNGWIGFQKASNVLKMANSTEYTKFINDVGDAGIQKWIENSINLYGGANGVPSTNTDWYDELTRTALMQNHSVDVTGGSQNTSYSLGVNYLEQEGILNAKNDYKRTNIKVRIDTDVTDWLKIGANVILSNSNQYADGGNPWLSAYYNPSIYPAYDKNNISSLNPSGFASGSEIGLPSFFFNPLAIAQHNEDERYDRNYVLPSFYAEARFLDDKLTFKSSFSQSMETMRYRKFVPEYSVGGSQQRAVNGLYKRTEYRNNWVLDNVVTYRDSFDKNNFSVLAGNSFRQDFWQLQKIEGMDIPTGSETYWYVTNGTPVTLSDSDNGSKYRGLSYFGRLMYDYDGKYLLTATMRADGSNKFVERWGYFPSVGLGWVMSQENFMKENLSGINFFKVRANWGKLGNDKVDPGAPFSKVNFVPGGIFNGVPLPGITRNPFFSALKWESTEEIDLGFDMNLLDNRLSVTFDYYSRTVRDAIFNKTLSFGAGEVNVNGGEMVNKGLEFGLGWNDELNKDFKYNVNINLSTLNNKVTDLDGNNNMESNSGRQINRIGEPFQSFYGYKAIGVYQNEAELAADPIAVANNLKVGDLIYWAADRDKGLTADDRVILGSFMPKFSLGGNVGFMYKQVDFNLAFQGQFNYKVYNFKRAQRPNQTAMNIDKDLADNYWRGEGSTNSYPSAAGLNRSWNTGRMNSFLVESGNYLTIQNIQMGYTFTNLIKSNNKSSLRLSVTAERPFNFFSYNGFTPQMWNGIDNNVYPQTSTYTFGVKFIY